MLNKEALIEFFFPISCPCCGRIMNSGEVFCAECEEELFTGRPDLHGHIFNGNIIEKEFCAVAYDERTSDAVWRLKRHKDSRECEYFADLICCDIAEKGESFDLVTAVPISPKKLSRRGFNQARALGEAVAKRLSLPYRDDLLFCANSTFYQHGLSVNGRLRHAKSIYSSAVNTRLFGTVLLVDDVITTGATTGVCAKLLKDLGAQSVFCACAASSKL